MKKRRVVVTGVGAVTPLGNSVEDTWAGLCAGLSGIGLITRFDTTNHKTKIAGELKNFDALAYVSKGESRRLDHFIIYAIAASEMALADAAYTVNESNSERTGVIIGSAIGGLSTIEREKETILRDGPRKISPFSTPSCLANLAAGYVSIRSGAKGPITCTVTACAAGSHAIGDAYRAIAYGYADAMITGGTEAAITSLTVGGFNAMRALSLNNEEPQKASRPFDRDRSGFVIAEGSGIVILEELSAALDRGARIYAELSGYGASSDAYHMAAPPPGHEGAVRCMKAALKDAAAEVSEVDYINAHGTSTQINDLYETQAIKEVFGSHARSLAVSSTKSMTGHMLGAAGGIEAVITAKVIEKGIIPPTINLDNPDSECDLDYVPNRARHRSCGMAMSCTYGFGGANAVLVFKKFIG